MTKDKTDEERIVQILIQNSGFVDSCFERDAREISKEFISKDKVRGLKEIKPGTLIPLSKIQPHELHIETMNEITAFFNQRIDEVLGE